MRKFRPIATLLRKLLSSPHTLLICVVVAMSLSPNAGAGNAKSDEVAEIELRSKQAESRLQRAIHYTATETVTDGATETNQAWSDETSDLLKVSTDRTDQSGRRELVEFFFNEDHSLSLAIIRKETPLALGGMKVEHERLYFGGGDKGIIRNLVKAKEFKPGEALDMSGVREQAQVPQPPQDPERTPHGIYDTRAGEIRRKLTARPPARDPRTDTGGDSARFRLIQGSISPNGRYALAIGLGRDDVDWKQFADEVDDVEVFTIEPRESPELRNYVIDLETHRIIGETGCHYFGTWRRYNHDSCSVAWSPDSATFVQLTAQKWNYLESRAGRITTEGTLAGTADVGEAAEKSAIAFVRAKKNRAFVKHGDDLSIAMNIPKITNDGVIYIALGGQLMKSDEPDTSFHLDERFSLRSRAAGLVLKSLAVDYATEQ
ncbi:MAG: hypothetical protein ABIZ36_06585 [Gemmatimonadaceae bacterium]